MIPGITSSQLEVSPPVWVYIGTTGSPGGSAVAGSSGTTSCRTSSAIQTWLTSARPPGSYEYGFIMKVTHSRKCNTKTESCFTGPDGTTDKACTDFFYQRQ